MNQSPEHALRGLDDAALRPGPDPLRGREHARPGLRQGPGRGGGLVRPGRDAGRHPAGRAVGAVPAGQGRRRTIGAGGRGRRRSRRGGAPARTRRGHPRRRPDDVRRGPHRRPPGPGRGGRPGGGTPRRPRPGRRWPASTAPRPPSSASWRGRDRSAGRTTSRWWRPPTALRDAMASLSADPTHDEPLAALDRALAAAEQAGAGAGTGAATSSPARLAAARSELDELRRLVAAGADSAALARAKIADPGGLLEPLDPSVVDGPARRGRGAGRGRHRRWALGPWLARIEAQAQAGGWKAAADRSRPLAADRRPMAGRRPPGGHRQRGRPLPPQRAAGAAAGVPGQVPRPWAGPRTPTWSPCTTPPSRPSTSPRATCPRPSALVGEYVQAVNAAMPGRRR